MCHMAVSWGAQYRALPQKLCGSMEITTWICTIMWKIWAPAVQPPWGRAQLCSSQTSHIAIKYKNMQESVICTTPNATIMYTKKNWKKDWLLKIYLNFQVFLGLISTLHEPIQYYVRSILAFLSSLQQLFSSFPFKKKIKQIQIKLFKKHFSSCKTNICH